MESPSQKPDAAPSRLFRDEALESFRNRTTGDVVLSRGRFSYWASIAAMVLAILLILFVSFGSYTRRTTVSGQLLPQGGVLRLYTPQQAVVLEKRVKEGQQVAKGEILYVLSSDRLGSGTQEIQAAISQQIAERRQALEGEMTLNSRSGKEELAHLRRRSSALESEAQAIARQIEQQKLRVTLAEEAYKRYQVMADKEFIAREQLLQKEVDFSEQQSRAQALQRESLANLREQSSVAREIDTVRVRTASQNSQLGRNVVSSDQELTELDGKRRVTVVAPEAGVVTLINAEVGQVADISRPLVSLIPAGAVLEARLYAPSRSVGFIRLGDKVLLRYQAFPYQKFGHALGTVKALSTAAVPTAELTGFGAMALSATDPAAAEPVYAIVVAVSSQSVMTFGRATPLQSGMRLDADILHENRKIYEWLLEPLLSVTGRIGS
ncbi:MAG: HlyD family efflux transporter periplasmic adaptor subunit [Pseudomonadota bacterium]